MTINKDLEAYLDWLNEFYIKDFHDTMKKEYNVKKVKDQNNFYQVNTKDKNHKNIKIQEKNSE